MSFASNSHMSLILDSIKFATWLHVGLRAIATESPVEKPSIFGCCCYCTWSQTCLTPRVPHLVQNRDDSRMHVVHE